MIIETMQQACCFTCVDVRSGLHGQYERRERDTLEDELPHVDGGLTQML
jgi:hypothetical protein